MPRSHPTDSDLTGLGWGLGFGLLFKSSSCDVILEPGWRRKYWPRPVLLKSLDSHVHCLATSWNVDSDSTDAEETDPWIKLWVAESKALRCSVSGRRWLAGHILASCSKEICYLQAGPSERQTSELVFKDRTRPWPLYAFNVEPEAKPWPCLLSRKIHKRQGKAWATEEQRSFLLLAQI